MRLVAREDVIAMVLALEAAFAQSGLPATLFGWMGVAFWRGFHHLDGVHAGRLSVRGTAELPIWTLGRVPIMRVVGRVMEELEPRRGVPS